MIAIVTDSTAYVTHEEATRLGVVVVPMSYSISLGHSAKEGCIEADDRAEQLVAEHGLCKDDEEAAAFLRSEVAKVCAQVLADAGVYKQDEKGLAGIKRFMATVGYQG